MRGVGGGEGEGEVFGEVRTMVVGGGWRGEGGRGCGRGCERGWHGEGGRMGQMED